MQGEKHFCDQPPGGFKTPTIPQSLSISGNVWINSFHFQTKARASSTKKEQRPLSCPSAWISDAWIGDQIDWWPGHVRSSAFVARGCRCRWRIHSVRSNSNFPKTFNCFMAWSLFLCWDLSFWHWVTIPVGLCVMRTADSVLLTC